jgi:hypothetical protein
VVEYPYMEDLNKTPLFYPINFEDMGRGCINTLFWERWPGIGSNEDI